MAQQVQSTGLGTSIQNQAAFSTRLIMAKEIRFSEVISALSVALDITQGHPAGHCMRSALIGMRIAQELRLSSADRSALFYALLLKDLGCSSNAAKMCYLFGADDRELKHNLRLTNFCNPLEAMKAAWKNCAPGGSVFEKMKKMAGILSLGDKGSKEIAAIRCERGADISRKLQLPEATARAILDLDEHWDGGGAPLGLKKSEISLLGRICCLAQTVEVFFTSHGMDRALQMALERRGKWFDPELVDLLFEFNREETFWDRLMGRKLIANLNDWEPDDAVMIADEACLDRVAEAFAMVVDAKSPWTYQHSTRVAEITVGIASQFPATPEVVRDLRRAAMLHDIGKLGVSNTILDKPGKPTDEEFAQIRKHPEYTQRILNQVSAFQFMGDVAGAHHERLDGRGYHRGLAGDQIAWGSRVLTVADICEALTAKRPYREEMQWDQVRKILNKDIGTAVDGDCVRALEAWYERNELRSRIDQQFEEIDRLFASL
ncbi:MAG: HD domain-containing phosphohydrolase [Planctomycetales bacterium]